MPPRSPRSRRPTSTSRRKASATGARCWCRSRPAAPTCWPNSSASASRWPRTIRASAGCSRLVKERETIGYAYEAADASFELLARRTLGTVPNYFDVTQFDINVEQRNNAKGERVTVTMAVVKVKVGDDNMISAAEGNGPVNALDLALRKDLGKYQKYIDGPDAHRLSRAYPQWRHRGGDPRADRERGRERRALDHHRRLAQYHRRLVPGADGFDHLQAGEIRRPA